MTDELLRNLQYNPKSLWAPSLIRILCKTLQTKTFGISNLQGKTSLEKMWQFLF